MRKSFAILFAVLYPLFNMGLSVNVHMCGKTVSDVTLNQQAASCCEHSSACCHELSYRIALSDDHLRGHISDFKFRDSSEICVDHVFSRHAPVCLAGKEVSRYTHRPLRNPAKTPVYLSNRSLLI